MVVAIHDMEYACGGLAACGACLFTNPLDVIKTRLQLQVLARLLFTGIQQLYSTHLYRVNFSQRDLIQFTTEMLYMLVM